MIPLRRNAKKLAQLLSRLEVRLVCAESCTGGLVAATLTQVPGISEWFCGSAVTYRGASKEQWLGVDAKDIARNQAVNPAVAKQMAELALKQTNEADLAGAITGHLGPGAPGPLDGVVYVGVCRRDGPPSSMRHQLVGPDRQTRQREAAAIVLEALIDALA